MIDVVLVTSLPHSPDGKMRHRGTPKALIASLAPRHDVKLDGQSDSLLGGTDSVSVAKVPCWLTQSVLAHSE